MTLRLILAKNGETLFEIPLTVESWPKQRLKEELAGLEEDMERFSKIFSALSNEVRLRMMKRLFEDDDLQMGFADFMRDLGLNPKTVWECTRKLADSGLIERSERGKYLCPRSSQAEFLMVSLALRRLMRTLQSIDET
ncbi:MAG: winged helix-turn-helix domain-containing protein [Candidatus Bathyarchaeia archaeon]